MDPAWAWNDRGRVFAIREQGLRDSEHSGGPGAPGPHPWFQHVIVAQGPGLAGELALVPGGYPRVARDPVHGPREALEEVSAVVESGTLLVTEGQCCRG